ncbi:MAG TPA: ECF transporter S component [candidate division Zixibacteria bacterium]|nr:ECF transporter S component [candidate division Zixibacteria bacterium]
MTQQEEITNRDYTDDLENLEDREGLDDDSESRTTKELEMKEYDTKNTSLKIAILAIFTALGPALSISFIWFPYFELMTLTIFIGGMILGPLYGIALAIFSTSLFELIATFALGPGLPIFPFKIIAFIVIVLAGSLIGKIFPEKTTFSWRIFIATLGGLLTLIYDLLTNFGMIIFLNLQLISYFTTLIVGLPVTAARVGANTIIFAFLPEIYNRAINPILKNSQTRRRAKTIQTKN